jgi:hypothetical protein
VEEENNIYDSECKKYRYWQNYTDERAAAGLRTNAKHDRIFALRRRSRLRDIDDGVAWGGGDVGGLGSEEEVGIAKETKDIQQTYCKMNHGVELTSSSEEEGEEETEGDGLLEERGVLGGVSSEEEGGEERGAGRRRGERSAGGEEEGEEAGQYSSEGMGEGEQDEGKPGGGKVGGSWGGKWKHCELSKKIFEKGRWQAKQKN